MEAVLDREMPVNKRKDGRRWLLLIILLLLLIGVCNCPGRRLAGDRENAGGRTDRMSRSDGTNRPDGSNKLEGTDRLEAAGDTVRGKSTRGNLKKVSGDIVDSKKAKDNKKGEKKIVKNSRAGKDARETLVMHTVGEEAPKTTGNAVGGIRGHRRKSGPGTVSDRGSKGGRGLKEAAALKGGRRGSVGDTTVAGGPDLKDDTVLAGGPGLVSGPDTVGGHGAMSGPGKVGHPDTLSGRRAGPAGKPEGKRRNDSTASAARKPKLDSILQMKGWLAGVGLNQFFIVGGQEKSNYNSNGTTGGIGDYIPVPMVRYYFSRKLYVQLEAQFNAPQYTTKNLLANQSRDSASRPGEVLRSDLFIKKLFYFNLPLSIHYSPIPHLYIGGGIQYARLTNGVALYQDSSHRIFTGVDSFVSAKIQSFRNDSTYKKLKTNEFRLMLDLNYNFKRFVVGARYNRALSDFINLRISNTQVTQSRNSSFQVYLRYIIWDGRKKVLLPK
jgi:hypothetical protein